MTEYIEVTPEMDELVGPIDGRSLWKKQRDKIHQEALNKLEKRNELLNIFNHIADGFVHVCDVCPIHSSAQKWQYTNIDQSVMFDVHRSWIYALTIDNIIYKIGETGNLLGHRANNKLLHPSPGTKGRLSRYISGDATDQDIRYYVDAYLNAGKTVSFWAKKCNIITSSITVLSESVSVSQTTHKDQEMIYLDMFLQNGGLPTLNKARK